MFGIRRYRSLLVYIEMLFEFKYLISWLIVQISYILIFDIFEKNNLKNLIV